MAWVHQAFKRSGVTLLRPHLEYLTQHPDGYPYSQYWRHYHWARTLARTMRQVHRAGEKAFVDFSERRPVISDATIGELQPVELFVGVLGASRYLYAEACPSQELVSHPNFTRLLSEGFAESELMLRGLRWVFRKHEPPARTTAPPPSPDPKC